MKSKETILLIFMIIAGFIIGGLAAKLCGGIPIVQWLSYGKEIGLDAGKPAVIDLAIVKIAFGFEMNLNVGEVLGIFLGLFLYKKFK